MKRHFPIQIAMIFSILSCTPIFGIVPDYSLINGAVRIKGVDGSNPIIYDNDWWFDVFDNNYLWAQASLGNANLVGNIVSRDMWDWQKGYLYPMQRCIDDAKKAIALARKSGLKNIPDVTVGSDRILHVPESKRIEDTEYHSTKGSRLIIQHAGKATPQKPLIIIAGGPLTTIANAVLEDPGIAPNIIVFCISVSYYGYNGKDAWSGYIVAKRCRLVEWATRQFWERGSVFEPKHFNNLPDNPFCNEMKAFIKTRLGMANQLGDGAPLVWLYEPKCWTGTIRRKAVWNGRYVEFAESKDTADVLDIPRNKTDLTFCRAEFFRVLENPKVYSPD